MSPSIGRRGQRVERRRWRPPGNPWHGAQCRRLGYRMTRVADVRSATAADYPAVIALLEAAGLPTAGVPRTLDDFLVANRKDGLAGAIGLERYGSGALLRSAVV